jgi:hypothetical protein
MTGPRRIAVAMVMLLAACGGPPSTAVPTTGPIASPSAIPTERPTPAPPSPTVAASVALPVLGHTATLLLDGRVLVVGGSTDWGTRRPMNGVEIYDPATGSWATTGALLEPRSGHAAVLLSNGTVLVVGGEGANRDGLASAELYDPATGAWTSTGAMVATWLWVAATRLGTGDVLAVSQNHAELYDHALSTWSVTKPWASDRGNLSTLLTLGDGTALVAGGGEREGCAIRSVDRFDPATRTWTADAPMNEGRAGQVGVSFADGRVLMAGGGCTSPTSTEMYDPSTRTWDYAQAMIVDAVDSTITLLGDGRVLVLGGSAGGSDAVPYAEVAAPGPVWSASANLRLARAGHTATLLPNALVLVIGGEPTGSTELYDPRVAP